MPDDDVRHIDSGKYPAAQGGALAVNHDSLAVAKAIGSGQTLHVISRASKAHGRFSPARVLDYTVINGYASLTDNEGTNAKHVARPREFKLEEVLVPP